MSDHSISPSCRFPPLDLQTADLSELVATCEIDHTVGPIADTRGGSAAGYQRWSQFKSKSLNQYAERTQIETVPIIERQELKRILELSRGGIVVLNADSAILADDAAWNDIAKAPCAVLLVR